MTEVGKVDFTMAILEISGLSPVAKLLLAIGSAA